MDEVKFNLKSEFEPTGDQPQAILKLSEGYKKHKFQTLLGITGSGKTFTMANVIAKLNKPTLVLSHNKTLAAQLFSELKAFFPDDNVEYFVSYYDYYQPESYMPAKDMYIEKDAKINENIEKLRLKATTSLLSGRNTVVVSSVSCIYGLGSPEHYKNMSFELNVNQTIPRNQILKNLIDIQYERNDMEISQGKFRVRGDIIDIVLGYDDDIIRIEMFGDDIESISRFDRINNNVKKKLDAIRIFPARHYVVPDELIEGAMVSIEEELKERLPELGALEAHRLEQRTRYDLEMIKELGYCNGIENYSRHFEGRKAGQPPSTLMDFFPEDFLLLIDESHVTIPQIHGMYKGDFSRKKNLIDFGFRLPSAFDNRPLKFEEFEKYMNHTIFVSATPQDYELGISAQVVEQLIRPTGLLDPTIEVRPTKGQIESLLGEIKKTTEKGFRTIVTTLTKKMAEDLAEYIAKEKIKVRYLHSEIETLERTEIIRLFRLGEFDVLIGINLLREGIDIPEVELVAILDADKVGFLRTSRSLIQTIGRASRNSNGRVIMFADTVTKDMRLAISETERRRKVQIEYNKKRGIVPKTIIKPIASKIVEVTDTKSIPKADIPNYLIQLDAEMKIAAENLDFEKAIMLRDKVKNLKKRLEG